MNTMNRQQLVNEINRLRSGLNRISSGNVGFSHSLSRYVEEHQNAAKALLLETPITAMQADQLALEYCMRGHGRFLECVMGVVFLHGHLLPYDYAESVRRDYNSYETKMKAAGMPVKFITTFEKLDAQE